MFIVACCNVQSALLDSDQLNDNDTGAKDAEEIQSELGNRRKRVLFRGLKEALRPAYIVQGAAAMHC